MANVQMPVLFTISDSTGATLFGENITADLIENHLPFTLDRSGAFHSAGFDQVVGGVNQTSTLLDAFKNTFFVGDPSDADKLFYVNMLNITNTTVSGRNLADGSAADTASKVVDEFCNKLADAKSICGNIPRNCKTVEIIWDREMYEKMEVSLLTDTINCGRYNSSIYQK